MSKLTRRDFVAALSAAGLSGSLTAAAHGRGGGGGAVFAHGVASGDPLQDRVILWTRVTPHSVSDVIDGRWYLSTDPALRRVCNAGRFSTDITRDFTVKIDATGLEAGRTYYYRFEVAGARSPIGRTRTLPERKVEALRLAFLSCSNYPYGYFNAYANIAARHDLDLVLHLGDYLYEYELGHYANTALAGLRDVVPSNEIITLTDYRLRHALYKSDADLQEAHRQHPFITVWDDHEAANDAWKEGAENHNPEAGEGEWTQRRRAAIRAYNEYMPIRNRSAADDRIYRRFRAGDLLDLIMLDTRLHGRDLQAAFKTGGSDLSFDDPTVADASRSLLGVDQEQWLNAQLYQSKARGAAWRVIGQQVMLAQLSTTYGRTMLNADQWDGYAPARQRLFDTLRDHRIDNNVILTGDIHSSWASDVTPNPWDASGYDAATGKGVLGVEFVTPAVSSPGPVSDAATAAVTAAQLRYVSPHMKYIELSRRGYALLDITRERVQGEFYHLDTVDTRDRSEQFAAAYVSEAGANGLKASNSPSAARTPRDPAPESNAD